MQKLHLVGFTTDHKSLIFSARRGARSGGFVVDVDDALGEAVQAAIEALDSAGDEVAAAAVEAELADVPERPQSALSVREVQARLRTGRTVESVAAEAGVDRDWVMRFAAPVLAEQIRVIEATRNATFSRARLGPSALRIGPSVYRNLAAKGVVQPDDELDKGWSTRQVAEGRWIVTFTYTNRNRKQRATWELDLRSGEVRALDRLAGELAFVPGAPRPAVANPSAPAKPTKVPASTPTDVDRANAKRVSVARKTAEAQLADAARRGTKRSAEVAKRAGTPKGEAARLKRAAAALAPPLPTDPAPVLVATGDVAPEPVVAARPVLVTAEDLAPPPVVPTVDPIVAEAPAVPPARSEPLDPAASAVAMVREAAEAMLSDFASGRLLDTAAALEADRPLPTWDTSGVDPAWAPAEPEPEPEPVVEPERAPEPEPIAAPAPEPEPVVPGATPVPTRRRRQVAVSRPARRAPAPASTAEPEAVVEPERVVVPESVPEPAAAAEPEAVVEPAPAPEPVAAPPRRRPARALTAVQVPSPAPAPTATGPVLEEPPTRRLRLRRTEDKVVRTPIDLQGFDDFEDLRPRPDEHLGPRFRGDLAVPAGTNGREAPVPAPTPVVADDAARTPSPSPSPASRRRRSEPLRAR